MIKLSTPVQYEDSLDELNIVRPMELTDEVKTILDIPVVNAKPVDTGCSAIGKLLRCNESGSLLTNGRVNFQDTESFTEMFFGMAPSITLIEFSQVVSGVILSITMLMEDEKLAWCDSTGVVLVEYDARGNYPIAFYGTKIYFKRTAGWSVFSITITGLY